MYRCRSSGKATPLTRAAVIAGILVATVFFSTYTAAMASELLIIDDRSSGGERSSLGTSWRLITDDVMGGVSRGRLTIETIAGRQCLRLQGEVRLENSGGFVQAVLDFKREGALDASDYAGVQLDVFGNGETYKVHLRTDDVWLPWQSYRASFEAAPGWHTVRLPFADFAGYRIFSALDLKHLERIGIVAIGRAFEADLCLGSLALYRGEPHPP